MPIGELWDPHMPDRGIGHRLYDEYYGHEHDDDDDNDSIVESERQIHEFFVNCHKVPLGSIWSIDTRRFY